MLPDVVMNSMWYTWLGVYKHAATCVGYDIPTAAHWGHSNSLITDAVQLRALEFYCARGQRRGKEMS